MCRSKVNELSSEIGRFRTEIETVTQDQSSYVSYEKRYVTFHKHIVFLFFLSLPVCKLEVGYSINWPSPLFTVLKDIGFYNRI